MSKQIEQAYIESAIPSKEVSDKILAIIDSFDSGWGGTGNVNSVNGQDGNVTLVTDDINEGSSNKYYTEARVNSNVNPKILNLQMQVDNKAGIILPSTSQYVFVNYLVGDDSTGNGSSISPFKTINMAMNNITDADQNKPYVIGLLGAKQIETTNILVKPYVSIVGLGQRASYIQSVGFNIKPHPLHLTQASWVLLKNFYLGAGTGIDWDLNTLGGTSSILVLENLTVSGTLKFKGRSAASDYLEVYSTNISNTITLDSNYSKFQNSIISQLDLTNTHSISGISLNADNVTFNSSLNVTATQIALNNCAYPSISALATTGTVLIESYRGVPPLARQSLSIGTTLNEYAEGASASLNYVRTFNNTSDWDSNVDIYELSILASAHGKGINPQIQTFETNGSNFDEVTCNTSIDSSGNIKIKILQSPDLRFNGKIIVS